MCPMWDSVPATFLSFGYYLSFRTIHPPCYFSALRRFISVTSSRSDNREEVIHAREILSPDHRFYD